MVCKRCGPVMAQKQTHRIRLWRTAGLSAPAGGGWICPNCGGIALNRYQAKMRGWPAG
jgi:RNase P subunit RPR2